MSQGFIFNWRRTDQGGQIHVTNDIVHTGRNASFGIGGCSPALRGFLATHDSPPTAPIQVSFDLFTDARNNLFAVNID